MNPADREVLKKKMLREALERIDAEAEAYLAAWLADHKAQSRTLDPARFYLLARGRAPLDVTARFRSAEASAPRKDKSEQS